MALYTYVILLSSLKLTFATDCLINNVPEEMAWEKQLRKDLKCNNHLSNPPSGNISAYSANIRFIMKYFDFNSIEEVFSVQTWMFMSWQDDRLKWDPEKYYGIKETELSSMFLWTPGIRLFNAADSSDFFSGRFFYVNCHVKNTGLVLCVPKETHEATCNVKLTNWPYDVQVCSLEFGAWTTKWYNITLYFSSRAITMLGAEYGAEWFISDYTQVEDHTSERQLKMIFHLERETAGLAAVIVYPSIIITALSITSLFLDVRRNVRLGLVCFSMLSHYCFLTNLASYIPKESAFPPTILLYYRGSVVLTLVIILFTFLLTVICKLKSTPQNYIISINDYMYESYGKYFVFPRWDCDDATIDSKLFSVDWTKFANIINSVFMFIIIIAYISLYSSMMPKPVPVYY